MVRTWWQVDRRSLLRTAGLTLSAIAFVWLWPSLTDVGGAWRVIGNLLLHAYVLLWLLAATITVRSIGSREVLTAWFLGTFLVPTFVFVLGWPALNHLGPRSQTLAVVWAPLLEETALLLAVALMAWRLGGRPRRRSVRCPGLSDLLVVGFAIGGGYAVHEDALYGRVHGAWPATQASDAFSGTYSWAFPVFRELPDSLSIYHPGRAMFYGLLIALAVLLWRRRPWVRWLVPVGLLYGMLDHSAANYYLANRANAGYLLFGHGHVLAVVVVLAIPTALTLDVLRRRATRLPSPPMPRAAFEELGRRGRGPGDVLTRWLAAARYHRVRNAAINAAWREPDAALPTSAAIEVWGDLAFQGLPAHTAAEGGDERPVGA